MMASGVRRRTHAYILPVAEWNTPEVQPNFYLQLMLHTHTIHIRFLFEEQSGGSLLPWVDVRDVERNPSISSNNTMMSH